MTAAKLYLGIDPGLSGAVAFYDPASGDLEVFDVPVHEITVSGTKKKRVALHDLNGIIRDKVAAIKFAIIEAPGAMPGQGVSSMWNFGFCCGAIQGIVAANLISLELVSPAKWKKTMGLTKDKDACRRSASMLLPRHAGVWKLVKHDGRAEAALLAYYLAHELKGIAK